MGYFANSDESMYYEEKYCIKCIHFGSNDCPVMESHDSFNYQECLNKNSILQILIPRKDGFNEKCRMFYPKE